MIKGIGIDICQISRMNLALSERILSDKELEIFNSLKLDKRKLEFLAGRFSAKEAIFKALNEVKPNISMRDITIINNDSGMPAVEKPVYPDLKIWISISHELEYAIAQALVEAQEI